jgi:DNA helicase-2/ATP-dependent DNA helicase PcrA
VLHLNGLNDEQKKAVLHTEGPLLILAGAGAGKTKTVTHRILHLIKQGTTPQSILAITFTNKAAKEMRERVFHLIKTDTELNRPISFEERPFVSTFHSLGVHIIKENCILLGLPKHFAIFDRGDSKKTVKNALEEKGLDTKEYDPNIILSLISREKGNDVTLSDFRERGAHDYWSEIVLDVWEKYEATLTREKALDFDDLLLKTARLLKTNEAVRTHYQKTWKYIHVDEYQDTNKVQYSIMKSLAGEGRNICVVGDVDQNIYSWRGADIKNILNFERDFPGAKTILLEENYRSTQTILSVANHIIKKNKNRFEKNLFTKKGAGETISIFEAFDENDEARFVAEKSAELIKKGVRPQEIAVLYRANFQSRVLEEAFLAKTLPYQVLGVKFFERKEVRDTLAYLRASLSPDSLSDLKRIINVPPRGIGKVTIAKIFGGQEGSLSDAHASKWNAFKALLARTKQFIETNKASDAVKFVIKNSGMEEYFSNGTGEDEERLENVRELATLASKYDFMPPGEGIGKLLEEAALQSDQDEMKEDQDAVRLMTIHASKGLEFDYVFIVGLEQDLFPHKPSESKKGSRDNEEERRLFYVALTRARLKLFLTYANMRTIFGSRQVGVPSEFIFDVPEEYTEKTERFEGRKKVIYFDI